MYKKHKMKKVLLSYCSYNYKDAFDFVIKSWVENSIFDKIIIYTDSDQLVYDNPKVEIIKFFEPSNSWIIGTGRRLEIIEDYILKRDEQYDYLCFLDMDCYITQDFSEVFDSISNYFDIGLTRLNSGNDHAKGTATAGVFFIRNNEESKKFIRDWIDLAEQYKKNETMLREHKISFVQYSFTQIAFNSFHNLTTYKVLNLSEKIYNSERSDLDEWYDDIRKFNPKILHFKGNRYQDKKIVDIVFSIINEFEKKENKNLFDDNFSRSTIEPEFIVDIETLKKSLKKSDFIKNDIVLELMKTEHSEILKKIDETISNKFKDEQFLSYFLKNIENNIFQTIEKLVQENLNQYPIYKNSEQQLVKVDDTTKSQISKTIDEILSEKCDVDVKKIYNRANMLYVYQIFKEKFIREVFPQLKNRK